MVQLVLAFLFSLPLLFTLLQSTSQLMAVCLLFVLAGLVDCYFAIQTARQAQKQIERAATTSQDSALLISGTVFSQRPELGVMNVTIIHAVYVLFCVVGISRFTGYSEITYSQLFGFLTENWQYLLIGVIAACIQNILWTRTSTKDTPQLGVVTGILGGKILVTGFLIASTVVILLTTSSQLLASIQIVLTKVFMDTQSRRPLDSQQRSLVMQSTITTLSFIFITTIIAMFYTVISQVM